MILDSKIKNNKMSIVELMEFKNDEENSGILRIINNLPENLTFSIKNNNYFTIDNSNNQPKLITKNILKFLILKYFLMK